ncbi:hypothetical protein HDE_06415 [Halotydeus destructor]|nr:hypothetical protein HDE_06415 [Halotydeus destructor]
MAAAYQQFGRKTCLSQMDYGQAGNEKKYGQKAAPCYDLTRITNKHLGVVSGRNDQLTRFEYCRNMLKLFGVFEDYIIPDDAWDHWDFIAAKTTGRYIVPKVIMTIHRAL